MRNYFWVSAAGMLLVAALVCGFIPAHAEEFLPLSPKMREAAFKEKSEQKFMDMVSFPPQFDYAKIELGQKKRPGTGFEQENGTIMQIDAKNNITSEYDKNDLQCWEYLEKKGIITLRKKTKQYWMDVAITVSDTYQHFLMESTHTSSSPGYVLIAGLRYPARVSNMDTMMESAGGMLFVNFETDVIPAEWYTEDVALACPFWNRKEIAFRYVEEKGLRPARSWTN